MISDNAFVPLDPTGAALGDEVYAALGEAILDGRLQPGERLRDVDLARRLGVSRTPVREALQRLQRCGLVEVAAGRWTRVSAPDERTLIDTHEMVVYLLGNATRMALGRCDEPTLRALVGEADALVQAALGDDDAAMHRETMRLFTTVSTAADNVVLTMLLTEAEYVLRRNHSSWRSGGHVRHQREVETYRAFREAVAARDGDRAERLLRAQHGLS